jgi:hypothetical protein
MPERVSSWQPFSIAVMKTVARAATYAGSIVYRRELFERHPFPWSDDATDSHLATRVVEELNLDSLNGT